MTRILFVCLGNICRSPAAEGAFAHLLAAAGLSDQFVIDSAGTGAWHVGQPADRRIRDAANRRGIPITSVARQVSADDFEQFDHIFAMDADNLKVLVDLAPPEHRHKVRLFRDLDPLGAGGDVPDPDDGGSAGFDEVLDIVVRTGGSWLAELTGRCR